MGQKRHQLADSRLPASMLAHSGREPLSGINQTALGAI